MTTSPQIQASNPAASAFVAANAGSGKTSTLVTRVARLLLAGAAPEAILCVTYTKAGAAEMQRRLFETLGRWAVLDDVPLGAALARIDETGRDLSAARALFARALETPGGLKIQTIHGFCEKLLRRFPLEAGVSPGFTVLEDAAAADVSARARDQVSRHAAADPNGPVGAAYAYFSVALGWPAFNAMFDDFETRRAAIAAHVAACDGQGGYGHHIWWACGFEAPATLAELQARALARVRWGQWKRAGQSLLNGSGKSAKDLGARMLEIAGAPAHDDFAPLFFTQKGEPKRFKFGQAVDPSAIAWVREEQERQVRHRQRLAAATVAIETTHALTLARAYAGCYEDAKARRRALDFGDLVAFSGALLTRRADAAWVLYKLDGGIEHVLLDEAQDTAPEQWEILRAITAEFFAGAGAATGPRTVFAVGDEKQSIFSFQGAAPERLALETQRFETDVSAAALEFRAIKLVESYRSAPQILAFVDKVFADRRALEGLRPASEDSDNLLGFPLRHDAWRTDAGCVDLWPLDRGEPVVEPDPWGPVDGETAGSANKILARRIARAISSMVAAGEGVLDRASGQPRPCEPGDVLILVRRRNTLFHEIIRALKREGVAVGGADRLKLSEHGVYQDLLALGRFARFADDDLTLAALLRSPFCDIDETSLFDLAQPREDRRLWSELRRRAEERPAWREARDLLAWVQAEADRAAPFEFYGRVLMRRDSAGRSMRQRILTRLGAEGEDALDAFIGQALEAENRGVRDLESFIADIAATELEIKREPQEGAAGGASGAGPVRVMTVHGAKGLEAPIVILPDTTTRATAQGGSLLATADGGFLWAPRKSDDCEASAEARARRDGAVERESLRLLYVALTRARDRLIIAGVERTEPYYRDSWRAYIQRAVDDLPMRQIDLGDGVQGWRLGPDPVRAAAPGQPSAPPLAAPAWLAVAVAAEPAEARWSSPSSAAEDLARAVAPSPLAIQSGLGRYRRGDLIHRLLQILPDVAEARRGEAAADLLSRETDLTAEQRAEMAAAALAVLGEGDFAPVFAAGSRAEVALAGTVGDLPLSGRLDRLVIGESRVLVIDYKTNRPAPRRIEAADPAYVLQMALYAALLTAIFPGRPVEAALLWTDGPVLMPVPRTLMVAALETLPSVAGRHGL